MPFQKIYEVNFGSNQQANPIVNPYNWPSLQITPNSAEAEHQWKRAGLDIKIIRDSTSTTTVRNNILVAPPGGISINSRLFMKVTFLHPNANGPSGSPNLYPEPWAVCLCFSSENHFSTIEKTALVSCQFHRPRDNSSTGVRLNTPSDLQSDDPRFLESPLDYSQYNPVPPHDINNPAVVPVFTLEHSFSGYDASTLHYTTGNGNLKISRVNAQATDHRVYSQADIADGISPPKILALGIMQVSQRASGTMSVRLLTFEIWKDIGSNL